MSAIMVIPGSTSQIPMIKRFRELGYEVVCVNPYKDSPAFPYANYSEQYDILDIDACVKVAKKYHVCAVISDECDIAMPTVAAVSEALNLPSIGSRLAKLYTNKEEMRAFSRDNGFPCPAFQECESLNEAECFFRALPVRKMIIKPLDSNSSRGVYTITTLKELQESFDKSMHFSHSKKAVLCEEYIEGTEFTVDGIVLNGVHYSLTISKKKHYSHHPNIACELYFSHWDPDFDYEQLRRQNDLYVEKTGLPFGFTHAEYKFDGSRFVMVEIGARGGGNYISSDIVPVMTGLDNYKLLVDHTLNSGAYDQYVYDESLRNRCSILKFFDIDNEHSGKSVKKIEGEDLLKNNPKVIRYEFHCKPGDIVSVADNDSQRIGYYIAYGDTRKELDALIQLISEEVKLVFE